MKKLDNQLSDTIVGCDSWTQCELHHSLTRVLNEKVGQPTVGYDSWMR
jgi:hypothetical protein